MPVIQYIKRSKTKWNTDRIKLYADLIDYVLDKEKRLDKAKETAADSTKSKEKIETVVEVDYEKTRLKGKTFSAAGLSEKEEADTAKSVESNGGRYLYNFASDLDYLIYNPNSDKEPIKAKKARILQKKGKEITFITIEEYYKMINE